MNTALAQQGTPPTLLACGASLLLHGVLFGAILLSVRFPVLVEPSMVATSVTLASLEPLRETSGSHVEESSVLSSEQATSLDRLPGQGSPVRRQPAPAEARIDSDRPSARTGRSTVQAPQGPATAPSGVEVVSSMTADSYLELLRVHLVAQQRYPERARRRGIEGEVQVAITVSEDGGVLSKQLSKPSSSPLLNEEVLRMVDRADPFPKPPAGHAAAGGQQFRVSIRFALTR